MTEISARKIAWEISQGIRPNQFIGKKTKEVLAQELFSLKNGWNPKTMSKNEKTEFDEKINAVIEGILKLPKHERADLYRKVDDLLNP